MGNFNPTMLFSRLLLTTLCVVPSAVFAQKKPLDHSVYDGWKAVRGASISDDGAWVLYTIAPQEGDVVTTVRNVKDGSTIDIPRGTLRFTKDSKFLVGTVAPAFADLKKARRDKVKPEDMPKGSLIIVNLSTKEKTVVEKVTSVQIAEEGSQFILYKPEPPKPAPAKPADDKKKPAEKPAEKAADKDKPKKKADHKPGDKYILRNLVTGKEETLEGVAGTAFNKSGSVLALALSTADGAGDGIVYYDLDKSKKTDVVKDLGHYTKLALSKTGDYLAYSTDKANYMAKKPVSSLFLYQASKSASKEIGKDSLPKGWVLNDASGVSFSDKDSRVLYSTSPKQDADEDKTPDDEKVSVDIWNYQDPKLQPQQLLEAKVERDRGFLAVYDIAAGKSVQLGSPELQNVSLSNKGEGNVAICETDKPYLVESTWDPGYSDLYLIDVKSGASRKLLEHAKVQVSLSPSGKYVMYFDGKSWHSVDTATLDDKNVSAAIPYPVHNELDDHPDVAPAYGLGGWTVGEKQVLIHDRFDIWSVDPTGKTKPVAVTNGRLMSIRSRIIDLDREQQYVDLNNVLLDQFNEDNKQDGFASLKNGVFTKIVQGDNRYAGVVKAKKADTLIYSRESFVESPDVWLTDISFKDPQKITDVNPQQKNYNWGKAELVRWTSMDGVPLQGILIKPEDFDYKKKYPMIAYFYERDSDTLNTYRQPAPSASTINLPLFASNGYCIFIPDIPYNVGHPGQSALKAIVPGVESIVNRGYIDPKRLGIQGQSWGGYQVAYLVTATNMFAAAEAGAPVSDMFSAYGGIRYGSGLVRQMQYEHQQSRIGGTPWNSTLKYIENSPVFHADNIQTPLMIMSNDKDGAVPHTQGIEFFTALRRLGKPCWMVVYNDEDHNLMLRKNRKDLSIRLSQYFDHYLKGAPMPEWMSKGVPAVNKGKNMGLEVPKK